MALGLATNRPKGWPLLLRRKPDWVLRDWPAGAGREWFLDGPAESGVGGTGGWKAAAESEDTEAADRLAVCRRSNRQQQAATNTTPRESHVKDFRRIVQARF
jgi:hypothetical protein